ncbi:M12 family metallo-peptidase [Streptomyces sp. NPDC001941]|uniref:M12 family metallo-peptidase n=1 Tax=Streptomyces sp. NPDC001941 TaxID=3154659 RepID=UPI00332AA6A2
MRDLIRRTALVAALAVTAPAALPGLSAAAPRPDGDREPVVVGIGTLDLHARDFAAFCGLGPHDVRDDRRALALQVAQLPDFAEESRVVLHVTGQVAADPDAAGRSLLWVGEVDDDPGSFAYFSVEGACTPAEGDDEVTGKVDTSERSYLFDSDSDNPGRTEALEIDPDQLPRPGVPPLELPDVLPPAKPRTGTPHEPARPRAGRKAVIDVAVGYTPAAKRGLVDGSGSGTPSWAWQSRDIEDEIKAAAAHMNQALRASGVNAEVRVVHTFEAKGYTGSEDPSRLLDQIEAGEGELGRTAHRVREQYGADLVSVWVNVPKNTGRFTAGTGSMPGDGYGGYTRASAATAAYAYSTIDVFTATGRDPGFAHELGHNLGLWHDQRTLDGQVGEAAARNGLTPSAYMERLGIPPYAASRGYIAPDARYFTTMAYRITCEPFAESIGAPDPSCRYSGTFSSPARTADDDDPQPLGAAGTADAASVLNLTAPVVAAYRASKTTPAVPPAPPVKLTVRTGPVARAGKAAARPAAPYRKGARVALTATPGRYWKLGGWLVGKSRQGARSPLALTLAADTVVTAEFACRTAPAGGAVAAAWKKAGAERKRLGCPTGAAVRARGGDLTQRFEGGSITWSARTGKTVVK